MVTRGTGALAFGTVTIAALLVPATTAVAEPTATTPTLTLTLPLPDFRRSEAVFVRGQAATGPTALAGAEVKVLARTRSGDWRTVDVTRTNANGRFTVTDRPVADTRYRARLVASGITSGTVLAQRTSKARPFEERRAGVTFVTGDARTGKRTLNRFGTRVISQQFARGWLVKAGRSTSLVYGRMLRHYRKLGGVKGRLGAPVVDVKCGLMEGACVQRFQNGALYLNSHARKKVSVAYGRTRATPIVAAALSQVGYTEPYYRGSKYSLWQGSKEAWCGIFLAWASHASGSGDAIPRASWFPTMVDIVDKRMGGRKLHRPKVGRMAFIGKSPHHVALVVAIRGRTVYTIEGNMDRHGGSGHPRGVFRYSRPLSGVNYYADPKL